MVRNLIGLSLSFCMQDILKGNLAINQISGIITSTAFESPQHAFDYYYYPYWSEIEGDEEKVKQTLNKIWPLVFQPRFAVNDHKGHMVGHGFWLNTATGKLLRSLD